MLARSLVRSLFWLLPVAMLACGKDEAPRATPEKDGAAASPSPAAEAKTAGTALADAEAAGTGAAASASSAPAGAEPGTAAAAGDGALRPGTTAAATASSESAAAAPTASATVAAEEKLDEKMSAKDAGGEYAAWMQGQKVYKVGAGSVQAVAVAKGDFHVNDAYPHKVKLDAAPAGVSFPDTVAKGMTKTEKRVAVSVPFTATTPGPKTISGTFQFSVCNDTQCKMAKSPLSITINVE